MIALPRDICWKMLKDVGIMGSFFHVGRNPVSCVQNFGVGDIPCALMLAHLHRFGSTTAGGRHRVTSVVLKSGSVLDH